MLVNQILGLLKVEVEALAVKLIIAALSEKALGSLAVFRPQELFPFHLYHVCRIAHNRKPPLPASGTPLHLSKPLLEGEAQLMSPLPGGTLGGWRGAGERFGRNYG